MIDLIYLAAVQVPVLQAYVTDKWIELLLNMTSISVADNMQER